MPAGAVLPHAKSFNTIWSDCALLIKLVENKINPHYRFTSIELKNTDESGSANTT